MGMSNLRRRMEDDSGFSLSELIIVIGLLPVVLAVAWAGLMYATTSSAVSATQGNAAQDFANPMEQISRTIMQNTSIRSAQPDRIEVWTDRDMDGSPELDAFYVTADKRLVFERWAYNSGRTTVLSHHVWNMSVNNHNVSTGAALFEYYDKDGVLIPTAEISARAPSNAIRVRVRLKLDMGNGRTAEDVRDILFRNRS